LFVEVTGVTGYENFDLTFGNVSIQYSNSVTPAFLINFQLSFS
jgi:hypothetical protein